MRERMTFKAGLTLVLLQSCITFYCITLWPAGDCYCWHVHGLSHEVVTNDAGCSTASFLTWKVCMSQRKWRIAPADPEKALEHSSCGLDLADVPFPPQRNCALMSQRQKYQVAAGGLLLLAGDWCVVFLRSYLQVMSGRCRETDT